MPIFAISNAGLIVPKPEDVKWVKLYKGTENGVEGVSKLGLVTVSTGGDTTIPLGDIATGYGTEQWYT